MAPLAEVFSRVALLGSTATSLPAYRAGVLDAVRAVVPFDKAIFHALSPRVPLETGAFVGIDLAGLEASSPGWDAHAVALGRLRDLANERTAVTDRDAFPPGSSGRARFDALVARPLGVRSALMVHLVVREVVGSVIALFARADDAFRAHHVEAMRALAPAIAVADALLASESREPVAQVPTRLRCRDGRLTERQREIVEHVALGHTNAAIARALDLSPNTLRNHLADIFRRLGASNRADVVRLAVLGTPISAGDGRG